MKRESVLALMLACVACGPVPPQTQEGETDGRRQAIRHGTEAPFDPAVFVLIMEWPSGSRALCSATLIGRRTLLTAAHCVDRDESGQFPSKILASNEPTRPPLTETEKWINVVQQRIHPGWRDDQLVIAADAALLELESPPPLKPRRINRSRVGSLLGGPVRAVGYGITQQEADDSGIRRQVVMEIQSIIRTHYTIATDDLAGICSGDSGGPGFFTFPDGVERQIGIHSYGQSGLNCRGGTDARVDSMLDFIDPWFEEVEAPRCGADGQCQAACMPEDPDCACGVDGMCNAACSGVSLDPDCESACAANGLCGTDCATPDPDCASPLAGCDFPEDCATRICTTDAQAPGNYCSSACAAPTDCVEGYECVDAVCKRVQLPERAPGEVCGPTDFCTGGTTCTGPAGQDATCQKPCYVNENCSGTCEEGQNGRYCSPMIGEEPGDGPPGEQGCGCAAGSPGGFLPLAALGVTLLMRRRAAARPLGRA